MYTFYTRNKPGMRRRVRASAIAFPAIASGIVRSQESGSGDDRLLLAIQNPGITDVETTSLKVGFRTGPNGFSFDYTMACYDADTMDCGGVLGGDAVPIDSVSGPLPRDYSDVVVEMTIPDDTAVDCFVTVGGGPLDVASKCQLAGSARTDSLFYLAPNGVTVLCPEAEVGDAREVDGVLYTKRNRAGLDELVAANPTDEAALATSCTSGVTDMSQLFGSGNTGLPPFISKVSDPSIFNPDLSRWDTSSVTDMSYMLAYATAFNEDIGQWDVSSVTDMLRMFTFASAFDQKIGGWNVSSVTDMSGMFRYATAFSEDIGGWDVSSVIDMYDMFFQADAFDQDIGQWNTSSARTMTSMFNNADTFNQDISQWNTSSVTDMGGMFSRAFTFNKDISGWDTALVEYMGYMFEYASDFDQDLSGWVVTSVIDCDDFSLYSGMGAEDIPAFNTLICGSPYDDDVATLDGDEFRPLI